MQGGEYDTLTFSIICEPSRGVPSCMTQGIPRDFSVPLLPALDALSHFHGRERRRWGGAAAEDGERGMRCGVAVRNARGAVLPGETQCGAMADAARCDGLCTALRHLSHDAA